MMMSLRLRVSGMIVVSTLLRVLLVLLTLDFVVIVVVGSLSQER